VSAPTDYRALGRRGGLTTAATNDMREFAARARKSSPSSFEYWCAKVDPLGELDHSDREGRARAAQSLYFGDLAKKRKKNGASP
jgi:hypothetical protein